MRRPRSVLGAMRFANRWQQPFAQRFSNSLIDIGLKATVSPGASTALGIGAISNNAIGERPMTCQPEGVFLRNIEVIVFAIASEPAGILSRGVARRGKASSAGTSPR